MTEKCVLEAEVEQGGRDPSYSSPLCVEQGEEPQVKAFQEDTDLFLLVGAQLMLKGHSCYEGAPTSRAEVGRLAFSLIL